MEEEADAGFRVRGSGNARGAGPRVAMPAPHSVPQPEPVRYPTPDTRHPVPGTPYRSACNRTCSCSRYVRDSLSFVPSRSSTT